jgi:hypothetical protein
MTNSNGMDFAYIIFGYRPGKTEIRIKPDEKAKISINKLNIIQFYKKRGVFKPVSNSLIGLFQD